MPSAREQARVRAQLIADGHLTADSVSLLDLRDIEGPLDAEAILHVISEAIRVGMPRRRACLINPGIHLRSVQQFQAAVPWMSTAAFIDEREALEWLLNPEGLAGFRR